MNSIMELDDLKMQLRERLNGLSAEKSATELMQLFRKQTESAVGKILRNMLFEIALGGVLVIGLSITASLFDSWSLRFLALLIFAIMMIQGPVFYIKSRQLKALAIEQGNLRENLKTIAFIVGEFIRLYLKYTSWLLSFATILGGLVGFTIGKKGIDDPALRSLDNLIETYPLWGTLAILAFAALTIWGSYRYVRWAIWWSYGRYYEKLKQYVAELEF